MRSKKAADVLAYLETPEGEAWSKKYFQDLEDRRAAVLARVVDQHFPDHVGHRVIESGEAEYFDAMVLSVEYKCVDCGAKMTATRAMIEGDE